MIPLPPNWTEIWLRKLEVDGVFAVCYWSRNLIEYWKVWFLFPFKYFLIKHERSHAWGIKKCLSGSKFCIMAEDNDTWLGKLSVLPLQMLGLGTFCGECKKYLKEKGAL